jgi:hypothetical protein
MVAATIDQITRTIYLSRQVLRDFGRMSCAFRLDGGDYCVHAVDNRQRGGMAVLDRSRMAASVAVKEGFNLTVAKPSHVLLYLREKDNHDEAYDNRTGNWICPSDDVRIRGRPNEPCRSGHSPRQRRRGHTPYGDQISEILREYTRSYHAISKRININSVGCVPRV